MTSKLLPVDEEKRAPSPAPSLPTTPPALNSAEVQIPVSGLSCFQKFKRIDNKRCFESQVGKFSFLPPRRPVDIEFKGLTYSVSEGRTKGTYFIFIYIYIYI